MLNLINAAVTDGRFTILVRALTAAGMIDTLTGSGPFTLFAPTDAAFSQLPNGQLDDLLKPDARERLTSLMTLHAVAGKAKRDELSNGQPLQSINGDWLRLALTGDQTRVNGINILEAIEASNGFIYVLDAVLRPS